MGTDVERPRRLAFSTLACPGWSLERVVEAAGEYGYDGVELRLIDGELIEAGIDAALRRRVRSLLDGAALPVVAVDSSIRLAAADPDRTPDELRRFLDLAAEWRSPMVRVFGGDPPPGRDRAAALDDMAGLLARVAPDAERLGVDVVVETHDALSSAAAVADLLERVESPAVGVLWDVLHTSRMGESAERVLDLVGDRLRHVHVKDGRGRPGAAAWELALLGEGDVPMADVLGALRRRGYAGWLCVEWEKRWHPEIAEPEVALPQHAWALARLAAAPGA